MNVPTLRARRGFTLVEMVVSMTLLLVIFGLSTQLFRKQSNSVSTQEGRLDAQQNSRFAVEALDRELRVAGVGVLDQQPLLVMAGPLGFTFNADLVSQDTGDLGAVYIDPDVDSAAAGVMRKQDALTLPGTSFIYPETTYASGGVPSNAETISYWLSKDSTSSHSNEYILFRRVNALTPHVVARGIIYNAGDTVFQYFKGDTSGVLTAVSPSVLPLVHNATIHGAQDDTGKSAIVDSIRTVHVEFTSVYHQPSTKTDVYRKVQATIHLMNAGLIHHTTCGNAPLAVSPSATVTAGNGTTIPQTYVTISWSASVDDGGGEKDVQRYAIYRRLSTVTGYDEPISSVPAGSSTYTFNDTDVSSGQIWVYGVTAQDCTPQSSPIGETSPVTIP